MTKTFSLSRRGLFKGASLGAAALAAPQIMTRAAFAQDAASATVSPQPQFSRFMLGDLEVTTLNDGGRVIDDPQSTFGTNQAPDDVAALLEQNYLPTSQLRNSFTPTLVRAGEDLVLFDTGNGEGGREGGTGQMLAALEASGYGADDVTIVVLTHMHGDHVNGLTEGGSPTFANARYVTGQAEYDFWSDEARMGSPAENGHMTVVEKVVPLAENMTFLADGDDVVSGITAVAAFGHSPGHMVYRLSSGDRQLMLTADTANHFILSLGRPDWEVRFDMDKAAAAETRMRVFDMIAADRIPFIGYHMPFPAVGYVEKLDTGYRYIPETYQLDI